MPHSRKVVLFLPPYSGKILGAPLGLLSLAGSVRQAGFEPRIIDGALDADYRVRIAEQIEDCLCFGVSLLTGPMIRDAIEVSRMVKGLRPHLPVIFGGWHPSLASAQTLREDFVDIVVRHQGDAVFGISCCATGSTVLNVIPAPSRSTRFFGWRESRCSGASGIHFFIGRSNCGWLRPNGGW
jgi:hypothetical protein